MSNLGVVFYVLGALFTLYVIAATWKSRDASGAGSRTRAGSEGG